MSNTYMIIEHFTPGKEKDVYGRLEGKGRMMTGSLRYIDSWVSADGSYCFQLVEAHDPTDIETWINKWEDIVTFEVHQVISSKAMQKKMKDDDHV